MKRLFKKITIFLAVTLTAQLIFAADSISLSSLAHQSWQDRDGLPQNTVQAIVQTKDGYLWLGTEDGLARFDGVTFTVFNRNNTPEIKNNYITALFESSEGNLWIGTRGGGVIRFKDRKFKAFSQKEGLAQDTVRAIGEDAEGAIWIGTSDGLSRFKDDKFTTFDETDGLPSDNIRAILGERNNQLWIGSTEGITLFKDGKFTSFDLPDGVTSDNIRAIVNDNDDSLWIGTQTAGLLRFKDGKFENITVKNGLSSNYIRALHLDREGALWIGTFGGGVNRLKNGEISHLSTKEGLTGEIVRAIFADREGSIWLGTEGGGLNRIHVGKVQTITKTDGLSHNFIRAVRQMSDGKIWVGTEGGGINILENGRVVKIITNADGLTNNFITSIFETTEKDVWVGTLDGLNLFRNGKIQQFRENNQLAGSTVWAIEQTSDGAVWIGTAGGLSRWQNNSFANFTVQNNGLPEGNSRVLFVDSKGRLWIGSREGSLTIYENGEFTVMNHRGQYFDAIISSFYEDDNGSIWLSSNNGLIRFKENKFVTISQKNGLFHDNLHRILADRTEKFWLTSNGGIFSVNKSELNDFADGKIPNITSKAFTAADGMKSSECSGEAQPAGWMSKEGKLWIPTIRGLALIEPNQIKFNDLPPPIHIEKVIIEQKEIAFDREFELPAGTNELEFHYTALSFLAPENVRFRYRLEGLEDEWIEAGTRRVAFYTSLPPGRYRFQVIASNNDGIWNETGASFGFYQQPRFYQTWTFYILCLLALGLLGYGVYRFRIHELKAQFAAVTDERNRIAREWHDTLVAGFAAISWQLEATGKQLNGSSKVAQTHLEMAQKMVKHSLTEARRALWDLRSNINADLSTTLTETLRQLVTGKKVEMNFTVEGIPKNLPEDVQTNLLRIGQEAVSNVLSHSEADRIEVKLSFAEKTICLEVADNGHGFDTEKPASDGLGHFGLTGMRERAKKLGGKFDLKSIIGGGTRIFVEIPLAKTK